MMGQPEGSMFSQLRSRELFGGPVLQRPFVQDFSCEGKSSGTIMCNASTARSAPVFSLKYGATYKKFLAAADEDGYVSVINTARDLPSGLDDDVTPHRPVAQWTAHRNAIFDISWANKDRWMYTASGDMTIGLWDTSYAYKIASFYGHTGSVKTLSVSPHASEIFASGSCDGNLLVWDARVHATCDGSLHRTESVPIRHSVLRLLSPHPRHDAPPVPKAKSTSLSRISCIPQPFYPPGGILPTVTAVQFLDEAAGHTLASGGLDGIVRFWDLRYAIAPTLTVSLPEDDVNVSMSKSIQRTNRNSRLVHLADTPLQTLGRRTYAVTSLALRPNSSQLLVSVKGGHHLMYDVDRPEIGPVKWYGGHTVNSFYVKTSFSPDGSHFASGSSDDRVCIWQVDGDADGGAPYSLRGHDSEVTAVAWCPTDFGQLATTSDDYTIKLWNINRKQEEEKPEVPGGWVPLSRAEILLAAKIQKNTTTATTAAVDSGVDGAEVTVEGQEQNEEEKENNNAVNNTTRMMIDSDNVEDATTPAPGCAAVGSSHLARTATTTLAGGSSRGGANMSTGNRIRIANALRLSLQKPKMKRTKQQTLAEALHAAQAAREEKESPGGGGGNEAIAGGAKQQEQQRRPRSAGTSTSDEEEDGSGGAGGRGGQHSNTSSPSLGENRPMNI